MFCCAALCAFVISMFAVFNLSVYTYCRGYFASVCCGADLLFDGVFGVCSSFLWWGL